MITKTHILDHLRSDLSHTIDKRLQVGGELNREDGGVGNSQVGEPVNLQVGSNNTTVVEGHHGTRRRRVILGLDLSSEPSVPLGIGLDGSTGEDLAGHKVGQRSGVTDLSGKLETLTDQPGVGRVSQVVGVDDGVLPRVGRVQIDLTGGEGVLQSSLDGDGIVTSLGSTSKTQKKLDVSNGREDKVLRDGRVNRAVSKLDGRVRRGTNVLDGPAQVRGDGVLELGSIITEQVGNVGVSNGRVDEREEVIGSVGQGVVNSVGSSGGSGGLEDDFRSDVVSHVLSDTGEIHNALDTNALEVGLGSNSTHHQHVRRSDSTSSQDDFLVGSDSLSGKISSVSSVLNTGGHHVVSSGVGVDLEDTSVGQDVQVGSRGKRVDVSRLGIRSGTAVDSSLSAHTNVSRHRMVVRTHKLVGLILEVAMKAPHPFPPLGSGLTETPMLFKTVVHSPTTGKRYPG
jgi:hypothetical protein